MSYSQANSHTHIFEGASHFVVNGGFTTQNNYNADILEPLKRKRAGDAEVNSAAREPIRCRPDVHVTLRGRIVKWGADPNSRGGLWWIVGPENVGKSVVAQAVTEEFHSSNHLGASFFFSQNGSHDPDKVISTLAYRLAVDHPEYKDTISKCLNHNPTIVEEKYEIQFQKLILESFQDIARRLPTTQQRPLVIVLDGLDKCKGTEAQCEIIKLIRDFMQMVNYPLRWVVFSRPEQHLEECFSLTAVSHCTYKCEEISEEDSEGYKAWVTREHIKWLSGVLEKKEQRQALKELKGGDAQLMVDFLHSMLLRRALIESKQRADLRSMLCDLSGESSQFPRHYVFKTLELGKPIDTSGGFCDVYKVHYAKQNLCLRALRLGQASEVIKTVKRYSRETILWAELEHENILPFYGLFHLDAPLTRICLVSPWMENGNVVRYLEMNTTKPRKPLVCDIARGLEYLHGQDVVHGDLKGTNILVDNMGRACIADFGSSSFQTDMSLSLMTTTNSTAHRADRWAAPELSEDTPKPNKLTDIWSVGCVFFEVLTGLLPFSKYQSTRQINRVLDRGGLPDERNPDSIISSDEYDEGMRNLVHQCWASNPQYRPTSERIVHDLDAQGPTGNAGGNVIPARFDPEKQHLRDVMRKIQDVQIDLNKVKQILDSFRPHNTS